MDRRYLLTLHSTLELLLLNCSMCLMFIVVILRDHLSVFISHYLTIGSWIVWHNTYYLINCAWVVYYTFLVYVIAWFWELWLPSKSKPPSKKINWEGGERQTNERERFYIIFTYKMCMQTFILRVIGSQLMVPYVHTFSCNQFTERERERESRKKRNRMSEISSPN